MCRVPPALPECVSLKEGRPGCSERPLPLPRPIPSPLPCPSVPPVRPSCPVGTWLGAAADAASNRGGSLPCVTQLRLHTRLKQRPTCVSCVASDHNLVPWGLLTFAQLGVLSGLPFREGLCCSVPDTEEAASCVCYPGERTTALGLDGGRYLRCWTQGQQGTVRPLCSLTRSQHLVAWAMVTSASAALTRAGLRHSRHPAGAWVPVRDPSGQ